MNELPFIVLNMVAFPGETLNVHISELQHRQIVKDCLHYNKTFGLISNVFMEEIKFGTEMSIKKVYKEYADGKMDIMIYGISALKIINFKSILKNKSYSGGTVKLIQNEDTGKHIHLAKFKELVKDLFKWLGDHGHYTDNIQSVFDVGHKIGLKPYEEYKFLQIEKESDRLKYAINHLKKLIPALQRVQDVQDKLKQNGHFIYNDSSLF